MKIELIYVFEQFPHASTPIDKVVTELNIILLRYERGDRIFNLFITLTFLDNSLHNIMILLKIIKLKFFQIQGQFVCLYLFNYKMH